MIDFQEIIRQYPKEIQRPEFYEQLVKEYFHYHMLSYLFSGKYAEKISFIGGTALRYLFGIKRFSEDLDFDCFDLTREQFYQMTDELAKQLTLLGVDVKIEDKEKYKNLQAFRRVYVFPWLKYQLGLSRHKEARFFIKVEAESHHFNYSPQVKMLNGFEIVTPIRYMPLEILFASKIAAAVVRKKDRDFFDIVFLSSFAKPDFKYLKEKLNISTVNELKESLLHAAMERKLEKRKVFDCEHMLFNQMDKQKIRNFILYFETFDFNKFKPD